jgi:hypothetical protein
MTTEIFKIPLENVPQRFDISIGGAQLAVESKFNTMANSWVLSFFYANTGEVIVTNMPMVTGVDLFAQLKYLNVFSGKLIVYTDGDDFAVPTEENLGEEANLFYVDET